MTIARHLNMLLEFSICRNSLSYLLEACSLDNCQHRRLYDCITALGLSVCITGTQTRSAGRPRVPGMPAHSHVICQRLDAEFLERCISGASQSVAWLPAFNGQK